MAQGPWSPCKLHASPKFVRASCFEKRPTGDSTKIVGLLLVLSLSEIQYC